MKLSPVVPLLVLAVSAGNAVGQTTVAIFDGGIGSQPLAGAPPNVIVNDVRGVAPGGRPWEIRKLKAVVKSVDGMASIVVTGKGLILGGGNGIGTPALPRTVAATLFCGAAAFNSEAVPTNAAGDFRIRSALTPAMLPDPCETPILLIRNAPGGVPGAWFAAGIPKVEEDELADDE